MDENGSYVDRFARAVKDSSSCRVGSRQCFPRRDRRRDIHGWIASEFIEVIVHPPPCARLRANSLLFPRSGVLGAEDHVSIIGR